MARKFYLAYGSNLNVEQMQYRCPGAIKVGTTYLEGYRITFRGNRFSGVANIEPRKGSRVPVGISLSTTVMAKMTFSYLQMLRFSNMPLLPKPTEPAQWKK
ncbi:MAG: gamma-glutamylcyclotransferase [Oscillospiraceae bacterium]|nr:gamma-glutamylcyclotransferase [Oscillospiraceae bacterium]